MDKEMFFFYRNALARNLCGEYSKEFKKDLEDNERLFNLCLRQQSIPYFATACYQKWGLDDKFLKDRFGDLLNGKYTAKNCDNVEGYTYQLWCDSESPINVSCDIIHIMYDICEVVIPQTKCPTIYVSNKSDINITAKGYNTIRIYLFDESQVRIDILDEDSSVIIYKYSPDCNVVLGDNCNGKVKQFDKELRL